MAKMYPQRLPPDVSSRAEARLFDRIRRELPDEWAVLYSLGLASHPAKPWAEIDFVLIGPPGVYCLEVKGGRIARRGGRWLFTDRHNRTAARHEGPFEQVGPAATALHRHLAAELPWFDQVVAGYGVATPDVRFQVEGPDVEPRLVYDARDAARPFDAYVERLAAYWREWKEARLGRPPLTLSERERAAVLEELRGDFDLRPSLRSQVLHSKGELLRLTGEQYRVLDGLADNPRAIIRGGAGTGKTLLAVEEARRRAGEGEAVLLCCYNRRLGQYLRRALAGEAGVAAWHLHGLMTHLIARAGLAQRQPAERDAEWFARGCPELCLEALLALEEPPEYGALIVDEAQDLLLDSYLEVFDALLKGGLKGGHWRFFLDPNQDIFHATAAEGLARLRRGHPVQYRLSINCRNTAPIAEATALLSGVDCGATRIAGGPEVEIYWYRDEAHQRREVSNCIKRLLSGGIQPEDIVVLSRHRRENSCLRDGLLDVPYPLVEAEGPPPVPPERAIRYATIPGFKGLESDAVLVFDVDDLGDPDALLRLYVGASRARALLALFLDERVKEAYEARAAGRAGGGR